MMQSTVLFGADGEPKGDGDNTNQTMGDRSTTAAAPNGTGNNKSTLLFSLLEEDTTSSHNGDVGEDGGNLAASKGDNLFGDDPITEEADADLFGSLSLDEPTTSSAPLPATDTPIMNGSDLMGKLLGESTEVASPAVSSPAPAAASSFASKLSSSGLLGGTSDALFGDNDAGGSTAGGGDGLFDEVDAEEAEQEKRRRMAEEAERQRQLAAEKEAQASAAAEQLRKQQEQEQHNTMDNGVMHDLSFNDYNNGHNHMGMGVGGDIPKESVHPPQQNQYQQYPSQPSPQHQQQPQQGVLQNAMAGSYYYSTTGAGQMQGQPLSAAARVNNNATPQPSVLAGMHVGHDVNLGGVAPAYNATIQGQQQPHRYSANQTQFPQAPRALTDYVPPAPFNPLYGKVVVSDPMLIQGTGLFAGPPHWTYLVTVYSKNEANTQPVSAVRRRFRHFVALEDRIHTSTPGAILPARPDKHPARAIEEATARQSADFAMQRAQELSVYMNALVHHPYAGLSPELKLFLTLQDHIGTAWPEVSSSAFTRITAVGTASVEKLADTMDGMLQELGTAQQVAAGEDSAEILALAAYEGRRIGAVSSSVPKIEGAVGLIRERGDRLGATGLEMSKLSKDVAWCDRELSMPMEVLSSALLRSGRRTKRLGLELGAAIAPFVAQYRMCRYEQMAFVDRRTALKRRTEARSSADRRAAKLMMNQTSMQTMGRLGTLDKMEMEAAMSDEMATEAAKEADEVAIRLRSEVGRIGALRVKEWDSSMKVIASGMKEACSENAAIWEAALEAFKRELPDLVIPEMQTPQARPL
jgi:hypothetical protein